MTAQEKIAVIEAQERGEIIQARVKHGMAPSHGNRGGNE